MKGNWSEPAKLKNPTCPSQRPVETPSGGGVINFKPHIALAMPVGSAFAKGVTKSETSHLTGVSECHPDTPVTARFNEFQF